MDALKLKTRQSALILNDPFQPQELLKRSLDLVLASVAVVLLAPLLLAICAAIKVDSPGPAIFRQRRVARYGGTFTCLKFRTMYCDADENVHRLAIKKLWAGESRSRSPDAPYKLTGDSRVTRVGRWLRMTSLDELPQLFNVVRGEMSLVGPRPAIPYELEHYEVWHHERHNVRPGITGLWQVRGRGCLTPEDMLKLDVEYARTWSVWLDCKLIVLTIPSVLTARGAR